MKTQTQQLAEQGFYHDFYFYGWCGYWFVHSFSALSAPVSYFSPSRDNHPIPPCTRVLYLCKMLRIPFVAMQWFNSIVRNAEIIVLVPFSLYTYTVSLEASKQTLIRYRPTPVHHTAKLNPPSKMEEMGCLDPIKPSCHWTVTLRRRHLLHKQGNWRGLRVLTGKKRPKNFLLSGSTTWGNADCVQYSILTCCLVL